MYYSGVIFLLHKIYFLALHISSSCVTFLVKTFGTYRVEEYVLSVIRVSPRIVTDLLHFESPFRHLHEPHISTSATLVTKVTDRVGSQEVLERGDQERECRLEIDTVCRDDDIWFRRNLVWDRFSPV